MSAYYNEIDPFAAAWLRELIKAGVIADGEVDERSIEDVLPGDVRKFTQCHFFAGIGVWGYALRCAGWPDERPVWTGSCPCQPFSNAGKRTGTADKRHLWPSWFHLIEQCRPGVVFGEQVEAAVRQGWLNLVQADMEGIGYSLGAVGIPAAGFGAPHIRQRLYFVGQSNGAEREAWHVKSIGSESKPECFAQSGLHGVVAESHSSDEHRARSSSREGATKDDERWRREVEADSGVPSGIMADARYRRERIRTNESWIWYAAEDVRSGTPSGVALGDTEQPGLERHSGNVGEGNESRRFRTDTTGPIATAGGTNGFWKDADWLWCRDEKYRAVEPGTFPLAHGSPNRVGRLRGYGNALVAPQAEEFIRACLV